jgi:hypothetical protein
VNEPDYVRGLLAVYRALPQTTGRLRAADRQLAADLFHSGLPLDRACTALRLAISRRQARPADAPPLPLIRSLHYFRPVFEELRNLPHGYLEYLAARAPK